MTIRNFFLLSGCIALVTLTGQVSASEDAPAGPEASPNIYKVLDENDQWRILEAAWQPGQEDNFHSHPADRVSLYVTDCKLRLTRADGSYKDVNPKAGEAKARSGKPVASHKAKNIGDRVCLLRIVELK